MDHFEKMKMAAGGNELIRNEAEDVEKHEAEIEAKKAADKPTKPFKRDWYRTAEENRDEKGEQFTDQLGPDAQTEDKKAA